MFHRWRPHVTSETDLLLVQHPGVFPKILEMLIRLRLFIQFVLLVLFFEASVNLVSTALTMWSTIREFDEHQRVAPVRGCDNRRHWDKPIRCEHPSIAFLPERVVHEMFWEVQPAALC